MAFSTKFSGFLYRPLVVGKNSPLSSSSKTYARITTNSLFTTQTSSLSSSLTLLSSSFRTANCYYHDSNVIRFPISTSNQKNQSIIINNNLVCCSSLLRNRTVMKISELNLSTSPKSSSPSSVINDSNNNNSSKCNESVVFNKTSEKISQNNDPNHDSSRPTEAQLETLSEKMASIFPNFFVLPHDFKIYNKNLIFEDNIRNIRTIGLNAYAWQITKIKIGAHLKYGKVNMQILKITTHPEDGTIRVRWRIVTFPGNSVVFAFWQFKLWDSKESIEAHQDEWIDGFSIFHVNGTDGLIYKHVCDKVIPDNNTDELKTSKKRGNLAVKLGLAMGLIPGEEGASVGGFVQNFLQDILSNL